MQTEIPSPKTPIQRSFLVTLLATGVLIIAGWSLLRLTITLNQWAFLAGYDELSPLYLVLSGFIWFAAGLWVGGGLWRCKPWAMRAAQFFNLGYVLYFWADRLFLRRLPIQDNWFIPALLTLLWLALTFWATRKQSPSFVQ